MKINASYLRKAEFADIDILFEWVNDVETRKNAFDSHVITYEEHLKWFEKMMRDQNQVQYIMMNGDVPVGQVRLLISGTEAEIDYSISTKVRGYGYGKHILLLIKERVRKDYPSIKKLIGKVKLSNVASANCFLKNGFKENYKIMEYNIIEHEDANNDLPVRGVDIGK